MVPVAANGQTAAGNLVQNPGFEQALPAGGWALDPAVSSQGIGGNSVFGVHSGRHSLRLVPNANNKTFFDGGSYGFAQSLDFNGLRGQPVYYGGWLMTQGAATAVIRVIVGLSTGEVSYREVRVSTPGAQPTLLRDIIDVPDSDNIDRLVFSCVAEGTGGSAFFDDVFATTEIPASWSTALGIPDPGDPLVASVTIKADQVVRRIPRELFGQNAEFVYGGNGIWDETAGQFNPDMVRLGSDLGLGSLRFPGGFFSDFYHWSDGVGPPGLRPITRSMPGGSYTTNSFGTDEALQYADTIGGKLLITVNAGTGTAQEAADWVSYVNRDTTRVERWEVGNELYVDLSSLDPAATAMPPDVYANRYLEYARAMRAADPNIRIGAILDYKYSDVTYRPFPDWTQQVLKIAGPEIDFVAVHNAFAPALGRDAGWSARTVYATMLAAPVLVKASLANLSKLIDSLMGPGNKIEVAVTEWAPLFDTTLTSRFLDHPKTLVSALYCASILKALVEDQRTTVANAFKLVDALELSWIGLRDGAFTAKAPYYAMQLFTTHFGPNLLSSQTVSPGYDARSLGWVDQVPFVPYIEAVASRSDDGNSLYIIVINKHLDRDIQTSIAFPGFCALPDAKSWTLNGTALDANTGTQLWTPDGYTWTEQTSVAPGGRFYLGGPGEISVTQSAVTSAGSSLSLTFPAHSVTALELSGHPGSCN
jgi:alpha-N-arabinofuranosidase